MKVIIYFYNKFHSCWTDQSPITVWRHTSLCRNPSASVHLFVHYDVTSPFCMDARILLAFSRSNMQQTIHLAIPCSNENRVKTIIMPPKTRRMKKRPTPAQTKRPTRHSKRQIAKSQTRHESHSEDDHNDDINDDDNDSDHDPEDESDNDPSQSTPKSKTRKNWKNFSDKEKKEVQAEMLKLQNLLITAKLPIKTLLAMVGVNSSTWYRWQNECQLCVQDFPVKHGSLIACSNFNQKIFIGCLTNDFVCQLSIARESDFLFMHSFK